jgi:hypothetical protein
MEAEMMRQVAKIACWFSASEMAANRAGRL